MTQNIMTSTLEASGPKHYFFAFSILLDGLAHISAIFLLKMQKKFENRLTLMANPSANYIGPFSTNTLISMV
jgi:hypothetical protein